MGNSDVRLKHKVQLRKKVEEPQPTVEPITDPVPPKSNKWIWWVVGLIALCIIGYFIFSKSDKEQPTNTETEVVEEEVVATDSVNESTNQLEDAQDEANAEEVSEAAQPEQPAEESDAEAQTPVANVSPEQTKSNAVESVTVSNDVEAEAMKVIRGDYGIGQERKDKLGAKYQSIQNRVNELKREGVF